MALQQAIAIRLQCSTQQQPHPLGFRVQKPGSGTRASDLRFRRKWGAVAGPNLRPLPPPPSGAAFVV
jgi:hypothetical protein